MNTNATGSNDKGMQAGASQEPTAGLARLVLHQNKTWAENAIEHWLAMEPSDESEVFLQEIMRERSKDQCFEGNGPRRLRRGMLVLRRVGAKDKRMARVRAAQFRQYYREGVAWPFESTSRASGGTAP